METTPRYIEGIGSRKSATARVRVTVAGRSSFEVNDKPSGEYFPGEDYAKMIHEPILIAKPEEKLKVTVHVKGGGVHAQAEAVRMGLARALLLMDKTSRKVLKTAKMLRRDPRIKERRKFGLKKARKSPQWSKR
jgi:small subunit ribosomal protein S9